MCSPNVEAVAACSWGRGKGRGVGGGMKGDGEVEGGKVKVEGVRRGRGSGGE